MICRTTWIGNIIMTMREIAVKAMQEIGLNEAQIASRLTFMDTTEPHMVGFTEVQVPAADEQKCFQIAKGFFLKHQNVPTNN